ncbi:MAG: acetylxylan esterase [Candidatus Marinimicrobia bacterium]|jgi:cephalosporin-C deacetylase-like acetyl esterase|nr:acetylxylan esterase [Candidatus Neomarinimicrobiota bacterium]
MRGRTILSLLVLILSMVTFLPAQNLVGANWKFQPGDDLNWADMKYDDSAWNTITTGILWEQQGYDNMDGFAWYRTSVVIPSTFGEKAEKQGGFLLRLGGIDDSDAAYFNGELIGQTGDFPPNYVSAYGVDRVYEIPTGKVLWDKPNVIAIRVYDGGGGGGLYTQAAELNVKGYADQLKIEIALEQKDHVIRNKPEVILPVIIRNASSESFEGKLSLTIKSDFGEKILSQDCKASLKNNSAKKYSFMLKNLKPGFYSGLVHFESEGWNKMHKFALAIDPEKIISPVDAQADFEEFWQKARAELAQVDPQFKIIRQDKLCTDKRDYFLVEMRSLGNVLIRGWYSVPKKSGKFPAFLHVQGYSSEMQPTSLVTDDDFVSFGLNVRGHGNSRDEINPGFPGFLLYHLEDKNEYIYRGAYMDCVRAMDFLCSRPEVDASRIIVEGQSQGGALSFVTAALDADRVRLCVPGVPFLSDFPDYFKVASWPGNEFIQYVKDHPETNWEEVYRTLSYFDIKNLAPKIKAPLFMLVGLMDETCPPHINFAAYNNLNCPKEFVAYPYSGHGLPPENWTARINWIRQQLDLK